jgi:hypothetical protein
MKVSITKNQRWTGGPRFRIALDFAGTKHTNHITLAVGIRQDWFPFLFFMAQAREGQGTDFILIHTSFQTPPMWIIDERTARE